MTILEELRDASDDAMDKIGNDPNRVAELDDDDLTALALHMKTARPMLEQTLISFCYGDVNKANAALAHVADFSQSKLVRLVRAAYAAMKATHRNPSLNQLAALVYNVQVGVGVVMVEQERRHALKAGALN